MLLACNAAVDARADEPGDSPGPCGSEALEDKQLAQPAKPPPVPVRRGLLQKSTAVVPAPPAAAKIEPTGLTPLDAAARAGYLDVCAVLLAAGASPLELPDDASALLTAAVVADEPELVDALLSKGAAAGCVDDGTAKPGEPADHDHGVFSFDHDHGAFFVAVELGSYEIVQSFLTHAVVPGKLDINASSGPMKLVALHAAAARGRADVVEALLHHRASVDTVDASGRSALHHAAGGDHDDVLRVLVSAGARVTRGDSRDQTPLALAHAAGAKRAESSLRMAESMLHAAQRAA